MPPVIHAADRALLRPLSTLGKPKVGDAAVSFLRRTEYISSTTAKARHDGGGPLRNLNSTPSRRPLKRPSPEPDKDSPAYVKRKIDQSFSVAEQNLKDRSRVRHPSKRNVTLVDSYPLIPDPEAFPDSGTYVTIKFNNNPVPPSRTYDDRLVHSIFKPMEQPEELRIAYEAALQAHERDPANNPQPRNILNYHLFMPSIAAASDNFAKRFDVDNPDRDDDELYTDRTDTVGRNFRFARVRDYETAHEVELNHDTKYDDELVLAFHDDETNDQKGVYYYPVMQRSIIRPQRTKNIARTIGGFADADEKIIENIHVMVEEPTEEVKTVTLGFKEKPYRGLEEDEDEDEEQDVEEEQDAPVAEEPDESDEPQLQNGYGRDDEEAEPERASRRTPDAGDE